MSICYITIAVFIDIVKIMNEVEIEKETLTSNILSFDDIEFYHDIFGNPNIQAIEKIIFDRKDDKNEK